MAITAEKLLQKPVTKTQLARAEKFLPKDPRAQILKTELSGYKWPFDVNKVYEFDQLGKKEGDELGGFRKALSNEDGIVYEYYLTGPINNFRRRHIAEALGFNPENSTKLTEQTNLDQWPVKRFYQT